MGQTTKYALPYPAATDPADVPTDMQELAAAVEGMYAELAYAQITASVTAPVGPAASAATVVSAGAVSYDGSPIMIEFYCDSVQLGSEAAITALTLWDGGTLISELGILTGTGGAVGVYGIASTMAASRRLTPAAGSHTYIVKAHSAGAAGTITAGPGTGGANAPAYIRVTRA